MESTNSNDSSSSSVLNDVLIELKKNNELLEKLLSIQSNVQVRQRKFWFMAMAQVALIVVVGLWFGAKYGF
ncbi:MAG: hypothetical protein ABW094_19910 [Candidatus Thiodiazotropha sp.]